MSLLTPYDIELFKQGSHFKLYEKLGAHLLDNDEGCHFAVWAPHASHVSVIGDFNDWFNLVNPLTLRNDGSGIWEGTVSTASLGNKYKYYMIKDGYAIDKSDPFAVLCEQPPGNASIIWPMEYAWSDSLWLEKRKKMNSLSAPFSIYEIHLPSWRRVPEANNRPLTYSELAIFLPAYVKEHGFTHVEFLPVMEHPFYGSWGYQTMSYFAPSSRYGTPQDFMKLIDALHQADIGVILDWVPAHFPSDAHGLAYFDGTHLYEYDDPQKGIHPEWHTFIFNYASPQVRSFLISSAFFWLEAYHVDGLRSDAVASMLYLDYARHQGQWVPNAFGGKENLEAIDFLRQFNHEIYQHHPEVQSIAEESTDWPLVSHPTYVGGLGFGMKWNMGWMHDILYYMSLDPVHRKYHHNILHFSIWYAFSENFILPLSHDEVVHGKRSLLNKMPGDTWQKFANLRLLYGFMYGHPGKKMLFMGAEFGQWNEWYHEMSLDWHLLDHPFHKQIRLWLKDLNHFYRTNPAMYELDFSPRGFEWVDTHDWEQSVIGFLRYSQNKMQKILVVCNFTPMPRFNYRVGVPDSGFWKEMLNSDAGCYYGSGLGNHGGVYSEGIRWQGREHSINLTLPPLSALFFLHEER